VECQGGIAQGSSTSHRGLVDSTALARLVDGTGEHLDLPECAGRAAERGIRRRLPGRAADTDRLLRTAALYRGGDHAYGDQRIAGAWPPASHGLRPSFLGVAPDTVRAELTVRRGTFATASSRLA